MSITTPHRIIARRRPAAPAAFAFAAAAVAALLWLAAPQATAQDEPPPAAAGEQALPEVESRSALSYYTGGGPLMHFLLLCSVGTIAAATYCFINVNGRKMMPKNLMNTLVRQMQERDVTNAYNLCNDNPNPFTRVVSAALLKINFERDQANKASMEQAAGETLDQEETKQMLWVNYLNVFATIAPMLGLLGTVTGMIGAFDQLAAGRAEPNDLAGGIGTAMLTTAGGLVVGIPAMFFYFFFRNRLMSITAEIQKNTTFLIDILSGEVKLASGSPGSQEYLEGDAAASATAD